MKFVFLFTTIISLNAFAATLSNIKSGEAACYGREYSTQHMEKHDLQTVKKLFLKFEKDESNPNYLMLNVDASIKRTEYVSAENGTKEEVVQYKPYTTLMFCEYQNKNTLRCGIECDGGSAIVTWNVSQKANEITFKNNGFVMYGGCGEDVDEADMIWLEPKKGGDDVFKLYAVPAELCQK